jgi:hypothetical protein
MNGWADPTFDSYAHVIRKSKQVASKNFNDRKFVEMYDYGALVVAVRAMSQSQIARNVHMRRLRIMKERKRTDTTLNTQIEYAIKRLRRTELCFQWMRKLMTDSETMRAEADAKVERHVKYYRYSIPLTSPFVGLQRPSYPYGRRYASTGISLNVKDMGFAAKEDEKARSISLQGAPKEVRWYLCQKFYHDIDMANCFPTIAIFLGEQYGCEFPVLKRYTATKQDREDMLHEIVEAHELNTRYFTSEEVRNVAKKLPLMLLHGGTYSAWLHNHELGNHGERVQCIKDFAKEMFLLSDYASRSDRSIERTIYGNRQHFKDIKDISDNDDKRRAVDTMSKLERTLISYVLQSYEDILLNIICETAARLGWEVASLQFDGLFVKHRDDANIEDFIRQAEAEISTRMRQENGSTISIRLEEKPLYNCKPVEIFNEWQTSHYDCLHALKRS